MTKEELREKANDLPLAPGVYLMMDKTGKVIYVGKAKKLKNRVSQYFQDSASHTAKTRNMVSQVDRFDTIFVTSEFEALVLENSLIMTPPGTSVPSAGGSRPARPWTRCAWPCGCPPVTANSPGTSGRSGPV